MAADETYEVFALRYAERTARARQELFLEPVDDHDSPMPLAYYIWVVRNENRTIIVDTGFNQHQGKLRGCSAMRLPRLMLAELGIDAAKVEDVVITHMHNDHAGNLSEFPRARFHIQEREAQVTTGRWMLDDDQRHFYSADDIAEFVHRLFEKRVVFYSGDGDIAPGLTLHALPGHTMGMQALRVPTKRGNLLLASDATHYYEHWKRRVTFPICWSRPATKESYRMIEGLADSEDHVIPGHDPLVCSLYPAAFPALGDQVVRLDAAPLRSLRDIFD